MRHADGVYTGSIESLLLGVKLCFGGCRSSAALYTPSNAEMPPTFSSSCCECKNTCSIRFEHLVTISPCLFMCCHPGSVLGAGSLGLRLWELSSKGRSWEPSLLWRLEVAHWVAGWRWCGKPLSDWVVGRAVGKESRRGTHHIGQEAQNHAPTQRSWSKLGWLASPFRG